MIGKTRSIAFTLGRIRAFQAVAAAMIPTCIAFAQTGSAQSIDVPADATVESLFADFLHYARVGRFTIADAYAKTLLAHPNLDPVVVLEAADKEKKSVETLLKIIRNSTIDENAQKVLDLIRQGERAKRKDPERISVNIEKLGGDPQQEYFAIRHLAESGEYAIPAMVQTLLDESKARLWSRVIAALPKMGKSAVNPLVIALLVRNDDVRLNLIRALGEIGYPQAVPHLLKLITHENMPDATKAGARRAIARIEEITGKALPGGGEDHFYGLAEKYYNEDETVRADPRLDEANVWYWDEPAQGLNRVPVPTKIFGQVMAMRCAEESLRLRNDYVDAIALWLAGNTRREARLGMNVERGDPSEKGGSDPTRPANFPRALYFTQAAGPRYALLILERAVKDNDSAVALGAIEGLRVTAGESSLIGTEDYKQPLVQALRFPDTVVRIRAALALGAALPKSQFADSQFVVPVLAKAITLTGKEQLVVIDPNEQNRNRVMDALRSAGRDVVGGAGFYATIQRARVELQNLSAVFVASDITDPSLGRAVSDLRSEFAFAKTPVILLRKTGHEVLVEELRLADRYLESVDAAVGEDEFVDAWQRVLERSGGVPLNEDLALSLALRAVETLRRIAVDGRTVYRYELAEPALIGALSSPSEELQIKAATVLGLIPAETAQRSIAHLALDLTNTTSLRVAVFGALAESAKNNGNRLGDDQVAELVRISRDENDLVIRTAASQALGAINLATNQASDIIRNYYGG